MKGSRRGANNAERKCKMAHEKCATCKRSSKADGWVVCANCIHNSSRKDRYEPLTNADRIRNMTDEEMAEYLGNIHYCPAPYPTCDPTKECKECWLNWLKAPADEHGGDEK